MTVAKSRDLFDDSTMSFGEHLEVLRVHLWKAIIGLVICVVFSLFFGEHIIALVRKPIDDALQQYGLQDESEDDVGGMNFEEFWDWVTGAEQEDEPEPPPEIETDPINKPVPIRLSANELAKALHELEPDRFPELAESDQVVELNAVIPAFRRLELQLLESTELKPVTLNVQEAFMTYLKVAFISGFVIASPWVFYQLWLFVAAGLYPHERKYVYLYLPLCLVLFLGGAVFCFFLVFPFVLKFLLGFNQMMGVLPQIRLSEWISFAVMLPVMFGLSFQLPIVMRLLERIDIFTVADYREKRRMSILVISIVSMLMTPADPASMLMMMFPLIALYEFGIIMCAMGGGSPRPEPVV